MIGAPLRALFAVTVLGATATASAAPQTDPIDRATICLRHDDPGCALAEVEGLLEGAPPEALRRDALALRAQSLALLGRAAEAREAFTTLLEAWPRWRPGTPSAPRVIEAFEGARLERIRAALPSTLDPGPAPRSPTPPITDLLPPPFVYAPERLLQLDREAASERPFSLSIGAGVALTTGAAASRYSPGVHVALDLGYRLAPPLDLWIQLTLALLPLDESLAVEPGFAHGLTTISGVIGARVSLELCTDVELVAAGGVGLGAFGLRSIGDAIGPAIHGSLGLRYTLDPNLALRLDLTPVLILPSAEGLGPAGHIAILVRGETRF